MKIRRTAKWLVVAGTLAGCHSAPATNEWDESWGKAILEGGRAATQICGDPDLNKPGTRVYEDCQRREELRHLYELDQPRTL